jgi:elongation factor Ts
MERVNMDISADLVKNLREKTGAGILDCKKALSESSGDMDRAIDYLRKKGLAAAAKKAGRIASEGLVHSYIHNGRVGVMVEINCETDFVARSDDFKNFVKDVAMHIAGASPTPLYVSSEEIDPAAMEKEKSILTQKAIEQGKKPEIVGKIIEGQIAKWKKDVCLLDQVWVRDPEGKKTIGSLQTDIVAKIGENIRVRRFVRWELGEGLEKRKDDFAAEVAKQAGM